MLVGERMTRKPVVVEPERSIGEALALLDKRRLRHLPVLRKGRLVGIVSDRDLRAASAKAKTVADVMTPKPMVTGATASVDEAARLMHGRKISALPVVEQGKLEGILTTDDVIAAFVDLSGVAEPTFRIVLSGADGRSSLGRVRDVLAQQRCELKWMHHDTRRKPSQLHMRLRARHVDDVVAALEGAGFEVSAVVAPSASRRP